MQVLMTRQHRRFCQALISSALLMAPVIALASISNDFPWDSFFSKIVADLTSNFVLGVATVGVLCRCADCESGYAALWQDSVLCGAYPALSAPKPLPPQLPVFFIFRGFCFFKGGNPNLVTGFLCLLFLLDSFFFSPVPTLSSAFPCIILTGYVKHKKYEYVNIYHIEKN